MKLIDKFWFAASFWFILGIGWIIVFIWSWTWPSPLIQDYSGAPTWGEWLIPFIHIIWEVPGRHIISLGLGIINLGAGFYLVSKREEAR